jgi:translation initiation factor IF-2
MNISTLAKILGVSIKELKTVGQKKNIYGFNSRNTRIPYNSAISITKLIKPERLDKLNTDDNKIYIPQTVTVAELSDSIGKASGIVVKTLLMNGVMATLNEKIDYDTASLISEELGVEIHPENPEMFQDDADTNLIRSVEYDTPDSEKTMVERNPIVTIMGHVDHGKTTLLDYIRKSKVAEGEAGSITQHISSYKINYNKKNITFLDTPGHEAFTAMRARGGQIADFVILVVSAVEGPKPQTIEVIERSKISKTPVIVALNKIDLPGADVEKVKNEIAKFGLVPEEWGGEVPFIPISAKTGEGVDKLLENILLHTEVANLKAEVDCPGQAIVIESNLDRQMGVTATVLVNKNVLKVGDIIRAGEYVGKIRKLENDLGKTIQKAKVGDPVLLIGLPEVISMGEAVIVYNSQKQAQTDATIEKNKRQNRRVNYYKENVSDAKNQINVVLVADVSGSLEAFKEAIIKTPQEHAKIIIKDEVIGQVNEKDVQFADTSNSTILAFHTKITQKAESLMARLKVNMVASDIIYELLEWVEEEILKHIKHEVKTTVVGKAEVLATFKSEKSTIQVFGGEVIDGKLVESKEIRIVRDKKEIGRMEIVELQKNKQKVSEVNISQQFGISAKGKVKVQKGDILESLEETIVR